MTLQEKFASLTTEQHRKFSAIEDGAGLDTFLTETGLELTADEKEQVTEFITSGKQPLSDDDLDAVAGGNNQVHQYMKKQAQDEGRTHVVGVYHALNYSFFDGPNKWYAFTCGVCGCPDTTFSEAHFNTRDYWEGFSTCKCYMCGCHTAQILATRDRNSSVIKWECGAKVF